MKTQVGGRRTRFGSVLGAASAFLLASACGGGDPTLSETDTAATTGELVSDFVDRALPNPTAEVIYDWAPLPDGREWGSTAGIDIGPDGHVWAYDRCGGGLDGGCEANPTLDPIFKFDRQSGEVLTSFGAGLFVTPHGFHVDIEGNVWVTDFAGNEAGTKGHQVIKLSPRGEVLLRLGEAGVAGSGPGQLNQPCDVITAESGDIFVADGHSGQSPSPPEGATGRILKYDREGHLLEEWGEIGFRPGQFRTPHALALDSQGRLWVADRGNHRIQVFHQDGSAVLGDDGRPLIQRSYGRVSGLFITPDDTLYAIDSESSPQTHPGWKNGIRIGSVSEDRPTAFVPPHESDRRPAYGVAGEGVAVDADGNIYVAEGPASRRAAGGGITKYLARK